jgi:hypothetical protein
VRQARFNAARAAIRHPGPFRDFYDRRVGDNNRPGKIALTAVMRKRGRVEQRPAPEAVGSPCQPHAKPPVHRAGRVKAAAAPGGGA